MTKITDMISELKEFEMDENILDNVEMTKAEKERTASLAISKIRAEKKDESKMNKNISVKKAFNRKFMALAAAMVVVLAFGAVAYAAGWINLGTVSNNVGEYSVPAIEGSNQYKAIAELQKFYDDEWDKKNAAGDESPVSEEKLSAETKRIMDKYNLVSDGKTHDTKTIDDAFSKADINNFLGKNESLFEGKETLSWYSDGGRVGIMESSKTDTYYEINCTPDNVANFYSSWLDAEDKDNLVEEWDYTTDEGIPAKCQLVRIDQDAVLEDGEETIIDSMQYRFLLFNGKYVVELFADSPVDADPFNGSKDDFNKFIDGFDFNKLK